MSSQVRLGVASSIANIKGKRVDIEKITDKSLDKHAKATMDATRIVLGDSKNTLVGAKLVDAVLAYDKDTMTMATYQAVKSKMTGKADDVIKENASVGLLAKWIEAVMKYSAEKLGI